MAQAILHDAATRLGLARRPDAHAFGTRAGFAVQLSATKQDGNDCVLFVTRVAEGRIADFRSKLMNDARIKEAKVPPGGINIEGDVVSFGFVRPAFRKIDPEHVAHGVDAILGALGDVAPPPPAVCRVCKNDIGAAPMLLNGVIDRVCDTCVGKLRIAAGASAAEYDRLKLHVGRALLAAIALSLAGALLWATIAVVFNYQIWLVAIGIGMAIGYGTHKAAGKGGRFVQILGALAGLASPLVGIVAASIFMAAQQDPSIGPLGMVVLFAMGPLILVEAGVDSLFAGAAGLLGGAVAAGIAQKPKFELTVVR